MAGSGNNFYALYLTSSTVVVQADTFMVSADGTSLIFQSQSINQIPGQPILYSSQASFKLTDVTSVMITTQAGKPTFSPPAGTYDSSATVAIRSTTAGCQIFYTLDGTTPTSSSTLDSSPFTIMTTTTVQAIAVKSGLANSDIGVAVYTIVDD